MVGRLKGQGLPLSAWEVLTMVLGIALSMIGLVIIMGLLFGRGGG